VTPTAKRKPRLKIVPRNLNPLDVEQGKRIEEKLREKGWSNNHLARILGVSKMGVSQWISGRSGPQPRNLLPLAHVLFNGDTPFLVYGPRRQPEGGWPDSIGVRIEEAMREKGWTEKKLASVLKVQPSLVRRWISDTTFPRPQHLTLLAKVLFDGDQNLLMHGPA
jgi:transcriptional regulator with XRE-family HTH domain